MSLARGPRAVVALAAVAAGILLVSCSDSLDLVAPDVDQVHINFACATLDSISLTDANGNSAWAVKRHPHKTIEWVVPPTVMINSIKGESTPLPIDTTQGEPHGGTPGKSYKAYVQNIPGLPFTKKAFSYVIDASCIAGNDTTRLVIDPELIIRKP